ncbi:MAG: hypothetical protein ABF636_00180 [Acetobacter sp.]
MSNNTEDNISISVPVQGGGDASLSYGYYFRMGMPDPEVEAKLALPSEGKVREGINKFRVIPSDLETSDTKKDTEYDSKFGSLLYSIDKINLVAPKVEIYTDEISTKSKTKIDYSFYNESIPLLCSVDYKDMLGKFEWSAKTGVKMSLSANTSFSASIDSSIKVGASFSLSLSASCEWSYSNKLTFIGGEFITDELKHKENFWQKYIASTVASNDKWFLKSGKHSDEFIEQKSILTEQSINLKVCSFVGNHVFDNQILAFIIRITVLLNSVGAIFIAVSSVVIPFVAKSDRNNPNFLWLHVSRYSMRIHAILMAIMGVLNRILLESRKSAQKGYIYPSIEAVSSHKKLIEYDKYEPTGISISKKFIKINNSKSIIGFSEEFLHAKFGDYFFHISEDGISMKSADSVISLGPKGILLSGKTIKIKSEEKTSISSGGESSIYGPKISMFSSNDGSVDPVKSVSHDSILEKYKLEVPEQKLEVPVKAEDETYELMEAPEEEI